MSLIDLQNISKKYDTKVVLKDVNFTLLQGEKVALIGQNGQGKSTLLKIIMNKVEADYGKKSINKSVNIEMLEQQPKFEDNLTVKKAIEKQLKQINEIKNRYEILTSKLEIDYENGSLLKEQSQLATYLDFHNAWDLDNVIERILKEFKLKEHENKQVNLLSGGEQRRVSLAGLLLKKPEVLLLDEPTNHLDVYMVEFLETFLSKNNFTLLFISHDRYFIDNIATNIIEIEDGNLRKFNGGYSNYLEEKQKLLLNMKKDHENLIKLLKREASWLQRGVAARRKRNERRKAQYFELKKKAKSNPSQIKKISLEIQREQKSFNNNSETTKKRKMLFELFKIEKSLGNKLLIKNFTTRILQKDIIGIVGPNGVGKSTLLKLFMGKLNVDNGVFKKGDFTIGYFDQNREMLDNSKSLMETFCPNGGDRVFLDDGRNIHIFAYLKQFLFPKEYLDKKIGVLSGGEKNRVALALLFTKNYDCLILDEPTNDLDIPTINILEEYLQNFQGALMFVSHDRYFVDKVATKLFVFKGYDGLVEESFQPYTNYLEIQKDVKKLEEYNVELEKLPVKKEKKRDSKKQVKLSYKDKIDYEQISKEIEELETKLEAINQYLSNPACYKTEEIILLSKELHEVEVIYEKKVERFLQLEELIESFKS